MNINEKNIIVAGVWTRREFTIDDEVLAVEYVKAELEDIIGKTNWLLKCLLSLLL